jgi:integrase
LIFKKNCEKIRPARPFETKSSDEIPGEAELRIIEDALRNEMAAEGKIRKVYSLHDLRLYAAVRHYGAGRDIISTQRFLGHGSVGITQGYLAGLDCE